MFLTPNSSGRGKTPEVSRPGLGRKEDDRNPFIDIADSSWCAPLAKRPNAFLVTTLPRAHRFWLRPALLRRDHLAGALFHIGQPLLRSDRPRHPLSARRSAA